MELQLLCLIVPAKKFTDGAVAQQKSCQKKSESIAESMSKSRKTTKLTPHHRVDILHHDSGLDYKNKFCIVMVTGLYPLSPAALFYTHCTPAMLSYQHTN